MQMRESLEQAKSELEAARHTQQLQIDTARTFEKTIQTLTVERDEGQALVANERKIAENTENRRKVAVSSIQRCQHEKAQLLAQMEGLREVLRKKDYEIEKLNEFGIESVQKMQAQDDHIALLESNEVIESFSRKVSCVLSEMGDVVILRSEEGESLDYKMRDLRDGIKDLVREVKCRRQNSLKMADRIYSLEEERLMWARVE